MFSILPRGHALELANLETRFRKHVPISSDHPQIVCPSRCQSLWGSHSRSGRPCYVCVFWHSQHQFMGPHVHRRCCAKSCNGNSSSLDYPATLKSTPNDLKTYYRLTSKQQRLYGQPGFPSLVIIFTSSSISIGKYNIFNIKSNSIIGLHTTKQLITENHIMGNGVVLSILQLQRNLGIHAR